MSAASPNLRWNARSIGFVVIAAFLVCIGLVLLALVYVNRQQTPEHRALVEAEESLLRIQQEPPCKVGSFGKYCPGLAAVYSQEDLDSNQKILDRWNARLSEALRVLDEARAKVRDLEIKAS